MNFKELKETLKTAMREDNGELNLGELLDYLPVEGTTGLVEPINNNVSLEYKNGKIVGLEAQYDGGDYFEFEIDPEICKDKNSLLNKLKELKVLHPETIDITRDYVDETTFITLYGCVDPQNPKIKVVTLSGGRGYKDLFLVRDAANGPEQNAIMDLGYNIKYFEKIKETSMGTLCFCRVDAYNKPKAFFVKDGKAKNATIPDLITVIKETN